jgi:hypothetical protein
VRRIHGQLEGNVSGFRDNLKESRRIQGHLEGNVGIFRDNLKEM